MLSSQKKFQISSSENYLVVSTNYYLSIIGFNKYI
ncbi:hypothetical protein SAMN05216464_108270 [Mucilaginibacter pineti]|uniref:Uncharacterized protein n=1 Tax=Mucilaginibacter pineti TaxID=1391627 RepID=A0A1G7F2W3_9SPHI|nr:hypothetical protein SAMN05216464_108270 [Mucilaginibacter pineti]